MDPVFSNNDRQVLYHVFDKKELIISDINIQKSEISNPRVINPTTTLGKTNYCTLKKNLLYFWQQKKEVKYVARMSNQW